MMSSPSSHLHLLLPSSTHGVDLEARLYLPQISTFSKLSIFPSPPPNPLPGYSTSTSTSSLPIPKSSLSTDEINNLKSLRLRRLITASHPYGRLGGNLLDPVISEHLVSIATSDTDIPTAVLAYNSRGVGLSGGSQPWIGTGYSLDDFAVVESTILDLLQSNSYPIDVFRFGYSWGSMSAINAPLPPLPHTLSRILLVAPPLSLLAAATYFSGKTFRQGLETAVQRFDPQSNMERIGTAQGSPTPRVRIIYGTADQFTGSTTYQALEKSMRDKGETGLRMTVVEGGDHFFRKPEEGQALEQCIKAWLTS